MIRSRQSKLGLAAVAAVALAAGGAAFAASRMHGSTPSARAGFGPGGAAPATGRPPYGVPGGGFGDRRGFGRGVGAFGALQAAATYLGVSQSELFSDLRSGKTLAQIANATSGKSEAGLVDALVQSEQKTGQAGSDLKARITALVEGSFGAPPGAMPRRGTTAPTTPPTHI